jgi:hypothetical protein
MAAAWLRSRSDRARIDTGDVAIGAQTVDTDGAGPATDSLQIGRFSVDGSHCAVNHLPKRRSSFCTVHRFLQKVIAPQLGSVSLGVGPRGSPDYGMALDLRLQWCQGDPKHGRRIPHERGAAKYCCGAGVAKQPVGEPGRVLPTSDLRCGSDPASSAQLGEMFRSPLGRIPGIRARPDVDVVGRELIETSCH